MVVYYGVQPTILGVDVLYVYCDTRVTNGVCLVMQYIVFDINGRKPYRFARCTTYYLISAGGSARGSINDCVERAAFFIILCTFLVHPDLKY